MQEPEEGEKLEALIKRLDAERWREMEAPEDAEKLEAMIERLMDDDEEERYEGARRIARLGRWVLPRTAALADDARPRMREMGAYILGQVGYPDPHSPGFLIRYPDGIPTLIRLLESDPDPEVRTVTAYALGFHRAPESIPALCHASSDPCPDIREAVASALGSCSIPDGDEELSRRCLDDLRTTLLRLADDEDDEVRNWATFGLRHEEHDTPEVRSRLWKALDDTYIEVRAEAAGALAGFGDQSFAPRLEHLLLDDEYFHDNYFEAAEELGDPALLPAVEDAAERWQAVLKEGEELSIFVTGAIEALRKAAEEQAMG